jgi:hypothetical protein
MKHIFGQHKEERKGKTMKLVLAAIHIKASPRALPLGLAMLAAVLRRTWWRRRESNPFKPKLATNGYSGLFLYFL